MTDLDVLNIPCGRATCWMEVELARTLDEMQNHAEVAKEQRSGVGAPHSTRLNLH